ncbi:MAG: hypothetical protein JW751_23765 [Polyangiaceae bacterium]|nr:hypothetical protein [Polyangiaceae bacterium]
MPNIGPLQHPDLIAVDTLLDERKLDEAQRRLAALGQRQGLDHGVTYLTTRLLYLRGRLDVRGVADRLRDLLRNVQSFPQAQYMLDAAETGVLTRTTPPHRGSLGAAAPIAPMAEPAPETATAPPPPNPPALSVATAERPLTNPTVPEALPPDAPATARPDGTTPDTASPATREAPRVRSHLGGSAGPLESPAGPNRPFERGQNGRGAAKHLPPLEAAMRLAAELDAVDGSTTGYDRALQGSPAEKMTHAWGSPSEPGTEKGAAIGQRTSAWGSPPEVDGPLDYVEPSPPSPPSASAPALTAGTTPDGDEDEDQAPGSGAFTHISTDPGVGEPPPPSEIPGVIHAEIRRLVEPAIPRAPAIPRIDAPEGPPSYAPIHARPEQRSANRKGERTAAPVHPVDLITRYSEAPEREEVVFSRGPGDRTARLPTSNTQASDAKTTDQPHRDSAAGTGQTRRGSLQKKGKTGGAPASTSLPSGSIEVIPDTGDPTYRIRSDFPPPDDTKPPLRPSLFEVATRLDAERYGDALALLGDPPEEEDPEQKLLRTRALLGAGRMAEAHGTLTAMAAEPALDVDLRAGVARLLLDAGDPASALIEARRASELDAKRPLVRLTLAWAAVRAARATGDVTIVSEADLALDGLKTRGGPHPGLVQALRGCVQAHLGDAERAIGLAQRALGLDPRSPDALAAVVVASARLHRVHDAQQAWLRLRDCAPREAEALEPVLQASRIEVPSPGVQTAHGFSDVDDARDVWKPTERAIIDGDRRAAQVCFEQDCRQRLHRVVETGGDEGFPAMSAVAVHALTEDPVWAHFAPFDLSLWSLKRVRAGMDLVYDPSAQLDDSVDDFPVTLLLGSYLGQVLCRSFGGHWEGSVAELGTVSVVSAERRFSPFAAVAARLRAGRPLELGFGGEQRHAHPGADAWAEHVLPSAVPPSPWTPATWPRAALLTRLGRAMSCSVVSEWCRHNAAGPLDGSMASLASIEAYLGLVAPPAAPSNPAEPWVARVSILVGAYVGEVLRETVGGAWEREVTDPREPADYRLRLGRKVITPVLEVHQHLVGRTSLPLHDYASRLAR